MTHPKMPFNLVACMHQYAKFDIAQTFARLTFVSRNCPSVSFTSAM